MSPADINAVQMAELVRHATQIADSAVVCEIEQLSDYDMHSTAWPRWYDVRPMLNEHENSPQCIDMNKLAIDYALMRGLAVRHPERAHLVRITRFPRRPKWLKVNLANGKTLADFDVTKPPAAAGTTTGENPDA